MFRKLGCVESSLGPLAPAGPVMSRVGGLGFGVEIQTCRAPRTRRPSRPLSTRNTILTRRTRHSIGSVFAVRTRSSHPSFRPGSPSSPLRTSLH